MSLSVAFRHRFPGLTLDVAFKAGPGVTALFGPSGCGKTTTINAIAGLVRPDAGRISLNGRVLFDDTTDLPPHRRRIGYVFQDGRLFPHLDVAGNLSYASRFAATLPDGAMRDRIVDLLGLGPLLHRRPAGLSGGEAQRVAIGRALLSAPELLVMDEPLAALDPARKGEILPYVRRLRQMGGPPVLYVSHAMPEIAELADHMVGLRDGRVTVDAPLATALSDLRAVDALGHAHGGALLEGRIAHERRHDLTRIDTNAGPLWLGGVTQPPGATLRLRILAHEVIIATTRPRGLSALNILPATVDSLLPGAHKSLVRLRISGSFLVAAVTTRSVAALGLMPGRACYAVLKTVALIPTAGHTDAG